MGIITLLISVSITIALLFLGIFLWSMNSGQFDDTTTPAIRMMFDDRKTPRKPTDTARKPPKTSQADKSQSHD